MLSKVDNEYLCQIGPGTPMGDVMRQYWIPALRSDELPTPDSPPVRLKLLGEELIAFRMTSGKVGLIQNACPHRGASLFFGRNEEEGLRCVYHGWKFDETGSCVDMPSEPAESNFRGKVHAKAYATQETPGAIWAYMGPREVPPPLPNLEAFQMVKGPESISILHRPCNWMQGWEGEMDTVHAAFLHFGHANYEKLKPGSFDYYMMKKQAAKFSVIDTDFGTSYGAYRPAEDDTYYWRIAHMLFPFFAMIPQGTLGAEVKIGAYVPMDDSHTLHWEIFIRPQAMASGQLTAPPSVNGGARPTMNFLPTTSDWFGRYNIDQTLANDYKIDREAQRKNESFTGIPGVRQQDMAVTETMGPIYDRSREHLGTTDQMIIRTRRKLIATAKALRENGVVPPGVDTPDVYLQRSGEVILPRSADWWESVRATTRSFLNNEMENQVPAQVAGS